MSKIWLVLLGSADHELDRIELTVRNPEACGHEVLAAIAERKWILSVGDRIEIQARE